MSFHQEINRDNGLLALSADKIAISPSTGISVLIVGAGVGGLMAALECRRKGYGVRILEKSPTPRTEGDFFSIGRNIIRHFYNYYPDLATECERINYPGWIAYHKLTGERISKPEAPPAGDTAVTLNDGSETTIPFHRHNRSKFVAALLAQAKSLGVEIDFGAKISDYFEENGKAGILFECGGKLEADIAIAADGVGTRSNKLVNGHDIRAYPSGFSIFRTCFPIGLATSDPDIRDRWPLIDGGRPLIEMWGGGNMAFIVQRYTDLMSWVLTHQAGGSGMESWSKTVDVSAVLNITSKIPEFPEIAERLIKTTPKDGIVDWEVMWRDPQENWTSPGGRVVQVGDSAHTFLPSSGNGATQAMEDAISLVACLSVSGEDEFSMATKVHNRLRFQRVSCIQLNGFINHQRQNNPEFSAGGENGEGFKSRIGNWISSHDPEKYALENYDKVQGHLLSGTSFEATNIPPGYTYKPWTIADLLDQIKARKRLQFDGDWS